MWFKVWLHLLNSQGPPSFTFGRQSAENAIKSPAVFLFPTTFNLQLINRQGSLLPKEREQRERPKEQKDISQKRRRYVYLRGV
jgi:hypothetical protein